MPSQLVTIVTAVVTSTVLMVVGLVAVVLMVTMRCRRQGKEGVSEDADTIRGVRLQVTQNTIKSTTYYEPKNLNGGPRPFLPSAPPSSHSLHQHCTSFE